MRIKSLAELLAEETAILPHEATIEDMILELDMEGLDLDIAEGGDRCLE